MKYRIPIKFIVSRRNKLESALGTIRWNGWRKTFTSYRLSRFVIRQLLDVINPFYKKL